MQTVKMYSTKVCPFCVRAETLLRARGVQTIEKILVDENPSMREEMMRITQQRTVPQIFIGTTWVGGSDQLAALDRAGKLVPLLEGAD